MKRRAFCVRDGEKAALGVRVVRDSQQIRRLSLKAEMQRRPCGAQPSASKGEQEAPHRRQERTPERRLSGDRRIIHPSEMARDEQHRGLMKVLTKKRGRRLHCRGPARSGVIWSELRGWQSPVVGIVPTVEVGEGLFGARLRDEDPVPLLAVGRGGCLDRDRQALLEDLPLDRAPEIEALSDDARRGEQLLRRQTQGVVHLTVLLPHGHRL